MELRKTAFYDLHNELDAKMIDYAGWALPSEYKGLVEEHNFVREGVGVFDVSHMGEVFIEGPDALDYVNYILSNDINKMENGKLQYNLMLNEDGGVVDDLIAFKMSDEKFLLIVNGANVEKDFKWMQDHVGDFDVEVVNKSDEYSVLAVQGPDSPKVLGALTDCNLDDLEYYSYTETKVCGVDVILSNSGYTGEKGYEIYAPWDKGPEIFKALLEEGAEACGLGCRDTLRFEAAMPLYGNEMSDEMNPVEAGLKFAIKLEKGDFVGKEAIEKYLDEGQKKKIVGIELKGKGIPRQGYKIAKDGKEIGEITTGYLSPTLDKPLANAIIDIDEAELGNEVEVLVRKRSIPAVIVGRRFLDSK